MVILLHISKTAQKKWKPRKEIHIPQNLAKVLSFFMVFIKLPRQKSWKKSKQVALPNLDHISSNTKSQYGTPEGKICSFYSNI